MRWLLTVEHPTRGKTKNLALPVKFSKTEASPNQSAPFLGQHTKEILLELGYSSQDIEELEQLGIINTGKDFSRK
ncbi:MAG: hypothetical protein SWO11_15800 [Thermodesulfobacteriota bacterium]|nr:hypothetical protein [Thermodesulfobacteriota bacterium]